MNVLNRKLLREMLASGVTLMAVASIVAIGITCYIAMSSAHGNLTFAQEHFYAQCRMADFSLELKKAPLSELEELKKFPGITDARARIQFLTTVDLEHSASPVNGLVLSLPDERQGPVVDDIVLRRGDYFTQRRANEVIVNESFAREHRVHPGQWIHLVLNNRRQELFVVGTAISSEFVYLLSPGSILPDPKHFGVFYVKQSFAEDVFDMDGAANQLLGQLSPELRPKVDAVMAELERRLEPYGVLTTTPLSEQASNRFLSNEIAGLGTFANIMPTIFLAVAALVLNVFMSRMAEQQRIIVGTLKATGYSDLQIWTHYLKFGCLVAIAGGVVGCIAGYLLAGFMTSIYQTFFEFPELVNRSFPRLYAIGLAVSVIFAVVGTAHGVWSVTRLSPAAAMRPKPPVQGKSIWLERFTWFWNQLGFGWRLTLRGLVRNRVRTLSGLFAASMGAGLLVNALMMHDALYYLIDFQFEMVLRSDVDLRFKDKRGYEALLEARGLPGVDTAEPILDVACTFSRGTYRKKGGISGLMPGAHMTSPRDTAGRRVSIAPTGLTMTSALADILHVRRGETVSVQFSEGLRSTHQVPVSQIVDGYLGLTVYADMDYLCHLLNEEFATTGVQLKLNGLPADRSDFYQELKRTPGIQGVSERQNMIQNLFDTVIDNQKVFLAILIVFAGFIFFASLLNTSLISLAERQREIATLIVLGYDHWQVGGLFLRENLVITLLGTILGLPFGYAMTALTTEFYNSEMFRIPVLLSSATLMWTLVLALVFASFAQVLVQRAIIQLDYRSVLQSKE